MKRLLRCLAILGAGGALCLALLPWPTSGAPAGPPIRIGGTLALTGPLGSTAIVHKIAAEIYLEQLNKRFDTLILATESTVSAGGAGFGCVRLGETDVRGHQGNVVVYRIDPAA